MTTKATLVELCSRQPGFDEIAWVMRARSTDEARSAMQCHQRFYFFFSAPTGAVDPGLLNESSINEAQTPCSHALFSFVRSNQLYTSRYSRKLQTSAKPLALKVGLLICRRKRTRRTSFATIVRTDLRLRDGVAAAELQRFHLPIFLQQPFRRLAGQRRRGLAVRLPFPSHKVQSFPLLVAADGLVRLADEVDRFEPQPVVAPGIAVLFVHPLLDDRPCPSRSKNRTWW